MLISFRNCIQYSFSSTKQGMGFIECNNNTIFALNFCILTGVKHVPSFAVAIRFRFPQCFPRENIFYLQCWTSCYAPATYNLRACNRKKKNGKTFFMLFWCCSFCCNNSCGITKMHFTMAWGEWNERTAQCECVFMSDGRCIYWHRQKLYVLFFCLFVAFSKSFSTNSAGIISLHRAAADTELSVKSYKFNDYISGK